MAKKNISAPMLMSGDSTFNSSNIEVLHKYYDGDCSNHWHDFYELEIICSGKGVYEVNSRTYEVSRASAYLVTPEDFHKLAARNMEMYTISFNSSMIDWSLVCKISECEVDMVVKFSEEEFANILSLLTLLNNEFHNDTPDRDIVLCNLLEYILICFLRAPELTSGAERKLSSMVMQAVSYIKQNFKSELSLKTVATSISVSPNYLGTIFKNEMGLTFNRYLMLTRLKYACNLLKEKNRTVEEVAYASGFASPSYFSESFRKEYGCSPTITRKQLINEGNEE